MEAIAKLKNCPSSPRKMRLVADLVRGMNVEKALFVLKYSNKQAARDIEKLLLSAVANWTVKNDDKSIDDVDLDRVKSENALTISLLLLMVRLRNNPKKYLLRNNTTL